MTWPEFRVAAVRWDYLVDTSLSDRISLGSTMSCKCADVSPVS